MKNGWNRELTMKILPAAAWYGIAVWYGNVRQCGGQWPVASVRWYQWSQWQYCSGLVLAWDQLYQHCCTAWFLLCFNGKYYYKLIYCDQTNTKIFQLQPGQLSRCSATCGTEDRIQTLRGRNCRKSCFPSVKMFSMVFLTSQLIWTGTLTSRFKNVLN